MLGSFLWYRRVDNSLEVLQDLCDKRVLPFLVEMGERALPERHLACPFRGEFVLVGEVQRSNDDVAFIFFLSNG